MQLVGATRAFITRPFIWKSVLIGFISAIIAIGMLMFVLYFAFQEIPELMLLQDLIMYLIITGFVILLGVLISWLSTWLAVRKFLRMKTDNLYH
jgi:cell division transport system permease protein